MRWPFHNHFDHWLILECPICSNKLQFKAVPLQNETVWSCTLCNNTQSLLLANLKTNQELIPGVDVARIH